MELREATLDDLDTVSWWDQQAHIIDADPDDNYNWEKELNRKPHWREQLVAELDGEAIGFVEIIDPYEDDSHRWGNVTPKLRAIQVWIGESYNLNRGYGTEIMQMAMARCFRHPDVHALLVDPLVSNKKAQRFYGRLGFKFVETKKINNESCYVLKLKREQYDKLRKS